MMKSLLDPQIISILISGSVAKKKTQTPHKTSDSPMNTPLSNIQYSMA